MKNLTSRNSDTFHLAQSASAIGAGILGFGIGAKWGAVISNNVLIIIICGGLIHIAGMYIMQMRNPSQRTKGIAKLLYVSAWVCLLIIVSIGIYLFIHKS